MPTRKKGGDDDDDVGVSSSYKPPNLRDEARIKLVSNEESKHDV